MLLLRETNRSLGSPDASATIGAGTDPGTVVGGEWAFRGNGFCPVVGNAMYGISSSGFGLFGDGTFPVSNREGPEAVNGIQYGLVSAGDDPTTGQMAVSGMRSLVQNETVFTLTGPPAGFDPSADISNVSFVYGTDLSGIDPRLTGVPEPSTIVLVLIGLAVFRTRAERQR